MGDTEWDQTLASLVGRRVRYYRDLRGMSGQQLADATKALGHQIHRSVIANLENNRRPTVTVHEVLVLAAVLRVPPALLVFDPGAAEPLEVIPGQRMDSWDALRWLVGDGPGPLADDDTWEIEARPLLELRQHDAYVRRWQEDMTRVRAFKEQQAAVHRDLTVAGTTLPADQDKVKAFDPQITAYQQAADMVADMIGAYRDRMRSAGMTPPPLPPELAFVDTGAPDEAP